MQWLRRSFITGFFVTVPLFISVAAFIWIFNIVDGLTTPLYDRVLGRRIPGLGIASTALVILLVGAFARNVIGRRVLQRADGWLLRVPVTERTPELSGSRLRRDPARRRSSGDISHTITIWPAPQGHQLLTRIGATNDDSDT